MLDLWNEVGPSTHEAIGARVLPSVQHAPRTFVPSVPRKGEDMRLRGRRVGPNNDLVGAADEATLYRLIHELESRKDFVIHFEAELKLVVCTFLDGEASVHEPIQSFPGAQVECDVIHVFFEYDAELSDDKLPRITGVT
jgi:hypothetical protein